MSTSKYRFHIIVLINLLFISAPFQSVAQIHGINSQYQSISIQEKIAAMNAMKNAYDQMENDFNSLLSYISEILSQSIDKEMRDLMTREFKAVSTLQGNFHQYGLANIRPAFNEIRSRIQREVVDYNNRIARAKEEQSHSSSANSVSETWSGTGFALNNGYIVTNAHVVDKAKTVLVYGINGDMSIGYTANIKGIDRVDDLAIIKIADSRFPGFGSVPYTIKKDLLDVGEDIWVLGYPLTQVLGNEIKLTNGIISSMSGFQGDPSTYQISAPLQPGNSGGPLFDSRGNIVGIVNAGVPGAENVGYAVKSYRLYNLADFNGLSECLPKLNTISSLPLKEQVKKVKGFVYLLVCSSSPKPAQASSYASSKEGEQFNQRNKASSNRTSETHNESPSTPNNSFSIIKGYIRSSDNTAVIGVRVSVNGSSRQTVTDASGSFSIAANEGETLVFTKEHFESISRKVVGQNMYIIMESTKTELKVKAGSSRKQGKNNAKKRRVWDDGIY